MPLCISSFLELPHKYCRDNFENFSQLSRTIFVRPCMYKMPHVHAFNVDSCTRIKLLPYLWAMGVVSKRWSIVFSFPFSQQSYLDTIQNLHHFQIIIRWYTPFQYSPYKERQFERQPLVPNITALGLGFPPTSQNSISKLYIKFSIYLTHPP